MTAPFPTLPSISLGNTPLDLSRAAASFISGQREERAQRREEAMKNALMQLQAMRIRPQRPFSTVSVVDGKLVHALMDPETGETTIASGPGVEAPTSQLPINTLDQYGNPAVGLFPRYVPPASGGEMSAVNPPSGQTIRPPPPRILTTETPGGTPEYHRVPVYGGESAGAGGGAGAVGGGIGAPKAQDMEVRRARDAFQMIQSNSEMENIVKYAPNAAQEAANYISTLQVGEGIPVIGGFIESTIQQAQNALSPEAAQYFRAFMNLAAAQAFSRGGATLTKNEINYSLASLAPRPFSAGTTEAMRKRLIRGTIGSNVISAGTAWLRYRELARQFGWEDLTPPTPGVQSPDSTGINPSLVPPPIAPPGQGTLGRTMNPRFMTGIRKAP